MKNGKGHTWTPAMRKAASKRMKAYHKTKDVGTIAQDTIRAMAADAMHEPSPVSRHLRDLDSIAFRYRRLPLTFRLAAQHMLREDAETLGFLKQVADGKITLNLTEALQKAITATATTPTK